MLTELTEIARREKDANENVGKGEGKGDEKTASYHTNTI